MKRNNPLSFDAIEILIEAVFKDSPTVYEAYSSPDCELRIFSNKSEVMNYIAEIYERKESLVDLAIHYPQTKGYIYKKKIDLVQKNSSDKKVRYSIEGWGMIQLHLWLKEAGMFCEIGCNSEKRAQAWEGTTPQLKSPNLWNWKEVQRHNNRLKRVLKKYA